MGTLKMLIANSGGYEAGVPVPYAEHEFSVPMPPVLPRAGEVVEIALSVICEVEEVQWDLDFAPTLIFRNTFDEAEWAAVTARKGEGR